MKKRFFLFTILFLILGISPGFAAFFRSSNSFTAPLQVLGEDAGGVWFGGFYFGAVALRFDRKTETWESYVKPLAADGPEGTVVRANGYLYYGNGLALFDEAKREWREPGSIPPPKNPTIDLRAFYKAGESNIVPPITFAVYKKYFPEKATEMTNSEGRLDRHYELAQKTDSLVRIGRKIWFGFSFYDSEGVTGVGGIGFYDERLRKTGILRLPELVQCSVKSLTVEGASLRIEQAMYTEAGEFSCGLPIYLNTKTGDITLHALPQNPGLHWEVIHSTKQTGNETWIALDAGLLRIFADGTWNLHALDHVTVQQETPAYNGPDFKTPIASVKPGEYRLLWSAAIGRGKDRGYFEVAAGHKQSGWADSTYICEKREPDDFLGEADSCMLRAQPSYDAPIIGWLGPAPLKVIESRDRLKKIEADGVWIPARTALLRPRLFSKGSGYTETRVPWRFTDSLEKVMLQTAKEERLAAEEESKATGKEDVPQKPAPPAVGSSPLNGTPFSNGALIVNGIPGTHRK